MEQLEELVDKHYGRGSVFEKIEAALKMAGKDLSALTVDDLAPVDEFHTRGRESTLELAQFAKLNGSDRVLDVGCGLGGTARHLVDKYRCQVVGIDLTEEYVAVGNKLTELVGLNASLQLRQATALELPFENEDFDVVWTEHVQMNIPDKRRFYSEIARVLRPGGRFLFHDIFRGLGDAPVYPVPWAEQASLSALDTEENIRAILDAVGLKVQRWDKKIKQSLEFFDAMAARVAQDGPPPLGIHLLMGDTAKEKIRNYIRNLSEDRTTVVMGLAIKI